MSVTYLPIVVPVVVALVVLGAVSVRLFRAVRLLKQASAAAATNTRSRVGTLRARAAALRVAVTQRRRKPTISANGC